jgi:methionine-rich copper-binding protein CopC
MKRFIAIRVILLLMTPLTTPQAQAHMPLIKHAPCAIHHLPAMDGVSQS